MTGPSGLRGLLGWVLLAWVLGLAVAALAYSAGPERLLMVVLEAADSLGEAAARAVRLFGYWTFDVVRGLAIGAFATFVVLCLLALHRGLRVRAALGAVALLWCLLVAGAGDAAPQERWGAALLLAVIGDLVITRRILLHADPGVPGPHRP